MLAKVFDAFEVPFVGDGEDLFALPVSSHNLVQATVVQSRHLVSEELVAGHSGGRAQLESGAVKQVGVTQKFA